MKRNKTAIGAAGALALALLATGCSGGAGKDSSASAASVTVENCGEQVTYNYPVTKLFVNDGNIISIALAAGAADQITAVSSLQRDKDVLSLKYGDAVGELKQVAEKYPSLENVIAADPQVMFAGWGYGFKESDGLTPDQLAEKGIKTYLLSETCRQADGNRGTMEPWTALTTDISNIGEITGNKQTAQDTVADIEARVKALESAQRAEQMPKAFLFDSASETIFSSGRFGAPQAMMNSAGVDNALSDVDDTWTTVSWERLANSDPDIIFFVDYPGQSYEEKINALESNPASQNLKAVKEKRYVNLPYAMWTSGPLNVDGAEYIRQALEHWNLQPASDIKPGVDITKLSDLPGNEWLR